MSNRFRNALEAQNAVNPSGLAFSLMQWQREILDAGGGTDDVRTDPACRLLVYQLAYLMDVEGLDAADYSSLCNECETRAKEEEAQHG